MNEVRESEDLDITIRAGTTFHAIAMSPATDRGNELRARALESYMASDDRSADDQLWSLAVVGTRATADELRKAGRPVPPSVVAAVDAPSSSDPRAGAWLAVLGELDGDQAGSWSCLRAIRDDNGPNGMTDAVAFLARLYRDARQAVRSGDQARQEPAEAGAEGGESG